MREKRISILSDSISEHITKYPHSLFHNSDSRLLHTGEAEGSFYGVCGGQIGIVACFSFITFVFPCQLSVHQCGILSFVI
jgi:hypothetical protein